MTHNSKTVTDNLESYSRMSASELSVLTFGIICYLRAA
jgi:hypothetical protein